MSNLFLSAEHVEQAYRGGKSRFVANARFSSLCMQSHNIDSRRIHSGQIQFGYDNNSVLDLTAQLWRDPAFHHLAR
jgi:hypothetical protein